MTVFGKKEDALPVHTNPEEAEHRDVLPHGKPRGVATQTGQSFQDVGMKPSAYKEDEYNVDEQFEHASNIRNRELYGSVSSGSTTSSDQSGASESGGGPNLLEKMKGDIKKPLVS